VVTELNINNKFIIETVNNYPYESKNESCNVNVAPIESTQIPVVDWDPKPTEEEWRVAQSIPLHVPPAKCVTSKVVQC